VIGDAALPGKGKEAIESAFRAALMLPGAGNAADETSKT
jgi:hypothetical protein